MAAKKLNKRLNNNLYKMLVLLISLPSVFIYTLYYFTNSVNSSQLNLNHVYNEATFFYNKTPASLNLDTLYQIVDHLNVGPDFNRSQQYCNIPLYIDPFDDAVMEYYQKLKLNCIVGHKLTYVDKDGFLRKNLSHKDVNCFYSFMSRKPHDQQNYYSPSSSLPDNGIQLTNDKQFVKVNCVKNNNRVKTIYSNAHLRIPKFAPTSVKTPSVLIFVLESLSFLSYNRFMLKTKAAIEKMGNVQILEGLTKVGRNSFPNSFALLTGIPMQDEDCSRIKHWDNKFNFLWDDFKKSGYITAFFEDMAQAGLFTYYSTGFVKQPTDWYPTPFWINMYPGPKNWSKIWKDPKQYCFAASGPKIDIFLDQLFDFHSTLRSDNQTYFMYSFYSQATHEDVNTFQYADDSVARFINKISTKLNDTIFIFMGDHGIMHGDYTDSPLGHMEGSLPFFGIRVPESLHKQYPHLREYLDKNKFRLTSWWDIRKMILDISVGNFDVVQSSTVTNKGPISPWREDIPAARTCNDAGIPDQWCVCNGVLGEMPKHEDYYKKLVPQALNLLNEALSPYSCPYFSLKSVIRINHILPKQDKPISQHEQMSLILNLSPNNVNAHFIIVRSRSKIGEKWSEWRLLSSRLEKASQILCSSVRNDRIVLID
ncbi:uncharacterized protein B4U79_02006 [Dinothrombium tinctorium]|uniref:Uncharacterized protein n=1 Tax=Dinothrombium tinctorium TaxID=1965070 RepID=A0A3S3RXW6_9ACAR|nr:uncharacterized protein B4U79_02006 [Dinothrombium tinctorium]